MYDNKKQILKSIIFNSLHIIRYNLYRNIKNYSVFINGKVLDFGCGDKKYQKLFSCTQYIGVDIVSSGHPESEKKADIYYDGKKLPFEDKYFDAIIAIEVLEHVPNIIEIANELNRVLNDKGYLLISTPFVWEEHEVPFDFYQYTTFGIKHIFNEGFTVVNQTKSGSYFETIIQLFIVFLTSLIFTKNGKLNGILNAIFICPFTLLALILKKVLPQNGKMFLNQITLFQKK